MAIIPYTVSFIDDMDGERQANIKAFQTLQEKSSLGKYAEPLPRLEGALILEGNTATAGFGLIESHPEGIHLQVVDNSLTELIDAGERPLPGVAYTDICRRSNIEPEDNMPGAHLGAATERTPRFRRGYSLKTPIMMISSMRDKTLINRVHQCNATFYPKGYDEEECADLMYSILNHYEKTGNGLFVHPVLPFFNASQASAMVENFTLFKNDIVIYNDDKDHTIKPHTK